MKKWIITAKISGDRIFLFFRVSVSLWDRVIVLSGKVKESNTCEPGHEKMCLMSYANNKGADQTARMLR